MLLIGRHSDTICATEYSVKSFSEFNKNTKGISPSLSKASIHVRAMYIEWDFRNLNWNEYNILYLTKNS